MRLDKFLAESAIGTRKVVRNYIFDGKVAVNDEIIQVPSYEVDENIDNITYLGQSVKYSGKVYYMLNKPGGCVTARIDANEKTVLDLIDDDHKKGLFPIGRLDKDTEGLLILTNDGDLDHKLMHPDHHVEKTYFFWAYGSLDNNALERLIKGVSIGKGEEIAKAIHVTIQESGSYGTLKDKMEQVNAESIKIKDSTQPVVAAFITISEGRKHQVKRMLKAVGCFIVYLKRVSIGRLQLDEGLCKGQYRILREEELSLLQ